MDNQLKMGQFENNAIGRDQDKFREYRRGNWSLDETMILIEGKKMDDERRKKRPIIGSSRTSSCPNQPQEMRWKFVEDYCWRKGCKRSQNQCNDRWDNLMRDYKRVRSYELGLLRQGVVGARVSYWNLERQERKERGLPSNFLVEIYEALVEMIERKEGVEGASKGNINIPLMAYHEISKDQAHSKEEIQVPLASLDSDNADDLDSPIEKRKRRRKRELEGLSFSIAKSASILAQAMEKNEEREERIHMERMRIEERRLKLDQSKSEITAQFLGGLSTAINRLAGSVLGDLNA